MNKKAIQRNGWNKAKLGDVVNIGSSKRIFYKEYVDEGVPFYRSKEIIEKYNRKKVSTELHISKNRFLEIKEKFGAPVAGDILLISVGTLGTPYIVENDEEFYFKDGNLTWLKKFSKNLLNQFLYYWIISPIGRGTLQNVVIGSTQPALTIRGLNNLTLNIPSLLEQKGIAEVLSSLDDKIDLLHRQNKTLADMAELLFRKWFVENADKKSIIGKLDDIVKVTSGKGLKKSEYSLNGKFPILGANGEIGRTNNYLFNEKLIFTGRVGTLGNIFISDQKAWLSDNTLVIMPKDNYFYFIFFLLKNIKLGNLNVGSTQPLIRQSDLKNIEFLLPEEKILQKFEKQAKEIFIKINHNQSQICTLENQRNTLLPKLMSGKVKIKILKLIS